MKKILVISVLALMPNMFIWGQNLVPNFSFEEYTDCPDAQDQIEYATGWSKFSSVFSTPDYYHSCSSTYGVPYSNGVFQSERRNCNAYAALVTWGASGNDREHIGIQLNQPLIIGQKYYISFYTVMGELKFTNDYFGMPSNNIGLRLSTNSYSSNNPSPIDNMAHLYSSLVIDDSINWQRISGSIIADSNYNYVIVGNFFNDLNTDTLHYNCDNCFNYGSYYLVDDVCVSTDSMICNEGINVLGCNLKLDEVIYNYDMSIYPNPADDMLQGENLPLYSFISIVNSLGQVMETIEVEKQSDTWNVEHLENGLYIIRLDDQMISRILIEHKE